MPICFSPETIWGFPQTVIRVFLSLNLQCLMFLLALNNIDEINELELVGINGTNMFVDCSVLKGRSVKSTVLRNGLNLPEVTKVP